MNQKNSPSATPSMPVVLASMSPYRLELLQRLHIQPLVHAPHIDETPHPHESPKQTAIRLAQEKTQAVAQHYPGAIIIGSDQVLMCGDKRLDKPGTHDLAVAQLHSIRGQALVAYTALYMRYQDQTFADCVPTHIHMRMFNPAWVEPYLQLEKPYHCAGALKSEGLGGIMIEDMQSHDPTAIIGLPLMAVVQGLLQFDYRFCLDMV